MKLGSLKSIQSRDGELIVVSKDNSRWVKAQGISSSLREAIENWSVTKPKLEDLYRSLNNEKVEGAFSIDQKQLHSPMPRAFQWADGSAFLHHVRLVRKSRGADFPPSMLETPLMYQGGSDSFLAPTEDIPQIDMAHGTDFEGEVVVVTDDVPMGVKPQTALKHIQLVMICNDVSLRGLIPEELAAGFGFFQSKPSSAFAPFALTLDELGESWKDGRLSLPLLVELNGKEFGSASAGDMHFHFGQLIAHAARTRDLKAGTIIGSGTVSNEDPSKGSSCIIEKRMLEKMSLGEMKTPFMKAGDTVKMQMLTADGKNLFGSIEQKVIQVRV